MSNNKGDECISLVDMKEALDRIRELEIILNDIIDCLQLDPDTPYEEIVDEIGYKFYRG